MDLNDKIDALANTYELETLPVKDTALKGHAEVKIPVDFFSALWYYIDIAHATGTKGWQRFSEIIDQFYNQEDIRGAKIAMRALEKQTKSDKTLLAAIKTAEYIIENTKNFDNVFVYPLETDNE